jgi:hypothetical protein
MAKVKFENEEEFKQAKEKTKGVLKYSKLKNNTSIVSAKNLRKKRKE